MDDAWMGRAQQCKYCEAGIVMVWRLNRWVGMTDRTVVCLKSDHESRHMPNLSIALQAENRIREVKRRGLDVPSAKEFDLVDGILTQVRE